MEAWHIDPDRWEELTARAKGIVLEHYRSKLVINAWEMKQLRIKGAGV